MKCPGPVILYKDCLEEYPKLESEKSDINDSKGFDGDNGHTPSYKKYGVTPDEWAKVYGDHALREINDARYPHKLTPHKRLRSDSENSDESTEMPLLKKPRYWSEEIQNRKRQRSESDSDQSDDPPLPKRYKKKRHIWRKKTKANVR